MHKAANILSALPKSAHPSARRALAEIRDAEDRRHAEVAIKAFADAFGVKWPKAVAKITDDQDELLAFFDFPAEHWVHLKTTNPIESTFATVRLRTKVTKGPGSKAAGLAMAFKLIEAAQDRWRAVNAPHLVALVRAGVKFRQRRARRARASSRRQREPRARRQRDDHLSGLRRRLRASGRQRFCSTTCRQAAWRRQRAAPVEPIVAKSDTVYECHDLRRPLPRRATLRRLQHVVPPTRSRRAMPMLRRACRHQRPTCSRPTRQNPTHDQDQEEVITETDVRKDAAPIHPQLLTISLARGRPRSPW